MNVRIHTSETTPMPGQSEFIRRRLEYALKVNEAEIDQVDAWIISIDRRDQGPAIYCKINVSLDDGRQVSSDGTEVDFYLAVHRAADRAGWEVSRSVGSRHRHGHATLGAPRSSSMPDMTSYLEKAG